MKNDHDDPELIRLVRTAGWLWLGYLAALMVMDLYLYRSLFGVLAYYLINGLTAAIFIGLSYSKWIRRVLKQFYLPLMLVLIAALPMIFNHLLTSGFAFGVLSNVEGMALRQMPVLFVALVIATWRYGMGGVFVYSIGTAVLELIVVDIISPLIIYYRPDRSLSSMQPFSPIPFSAINVFLFLALVRTISFVVVGFFINQLMRRIHAQQKSLADANARLTHYASTLESLTITRERNRMAHELHDTLAHSLTAISVQLETVRAYWDVDHEKARQQLDKSLAVTRSGVEETRRVLKSLRATPLEEMGLGLALKQLARSGADRGNLELTLSIPKELPPLSPDIEQCIYRVAQESIENVVSHANASHLNVQLAQEDKSLVLKVEDDGLGFDLEKAEKSGHFGLVGMRERAQMVGGKLSVVSQPVKGTSVRLMIGAVL